MWQAKHPSLFTESSSFFGTSSVILFCLKEKQQLHEMTKTSFHAAYMRIVLLRDPDGILYSGDSEFFGLPEGEGNEGYT